MITVLIIADLHFSISNLETMYREIENILYPTLKSLEKLDLFIVAGDLYDTKEYFASDVTKYIIRFIRETLEITKHFNTQIILIHGTRGHDNYQLTTLSYIFQSERLKVINKVEVISYKEFKILCIPEEYVLDTPEEDAELGYYKPYFEENQFYDIIVGHGMVDKIWYAKQSKEAMNSITKSITAPVFKVDTLLSHCRKCYFGHVHTRYSYKNFHYVGPFTEWEFGKDFTPGFYIARIDKEKIEEIFIENKLAPHYKSISLLIDKQYSMVELNSMIEQMVNEQFRDVRLKRLQIEAEIDTSVKDYMIMQEFLIKKVSNMKGVNLTIIYKQLQENEEDIEIECILEEIKEKPYVFDGSLEVPERIQGFIKEEDKVAMPMERVHELLSMSMMKK